MSNVEHIKEQVATGVETIRQTALGTINSAEGRLSDRIRRALDGLGKISVEGIVEDTGHLVSGFITTEDNSKAAQGIFAGIAEESPNPNLEGAVTTSGDMAQTATTGLGLAMTMQQKAEELAAAVQVAQERASELTALHAQVGELVPDLFNARGQAQDYATVYVQQIG